MAIRFLPRRPLGRTGFVATVLGVGDVADRNVPEGTCVATVRRALDAGLNVVDTAPGYEDGYSETIVGRALEGRRDGVFVIDKIDDLRSPVAPQVDESLARLGLPSTDLFVFHAVAKLEDWERLSEGGAFEALLACVRAGKTRFRGISSHHPDVLVRAIESGLCDVVMFPVGPKVDRRFVHEVLPLARRRGVGTACFKTFGAGKLLGDTSGYNRPLRQRPRGKVGSSGAAPGAPVLPHMSVSSCVRYTLSRDPDVAVLGLSFPNEQDAAFEAAHAFVPMTEAELEAAERLADEAIAGKGGTHWDP
jgi:1-deoxyxylulose-5-phosphate synthase